jgi:hypothetical protein
VRYPAFEQRRIFYERVLDRLRATPGIEFAAVSTGFPYVGQYDDARAQSAELARNSNDSGISADFNAVSADYLEAMGVRLLAETDTADTPKVAVIDVNLAKTLWPGQNPIGQLINTDDPTKPI